jgi:hypothetical protein
MRKGIQMNIEVLISAVVLLLGVILDYGMDLLVSLV